MADKPGDPNVSEKEIARQLLGNLENLTKGHDELKAQVVKIVADMDATKQPIVEIKNVLTQFDALKAQFEAVSKTIKSNNARALGMPGAEDEMSKFSLVRTFLAIKSGDWKDAQFEKDTLDQAKARAQELQAKGAAVADVGSRGGFFLPDMVLGDPIAAVYVASALINLDNKGSGTTRVSVIDGVPAASGSLPKVKGGSVSYWVGEEDKLAETMMEVGDITFNLKTLASLVRITQKMRDFAGVGFEKALMNDIFRGLVAKLDKTILYGTGTGNMPRGVANVKGVRKFSARTGEVETSDPASAANVGGELDFDDLDEMVGVLEDDNFTVDSSAAFIFHPRYKRRVKRLRVQNYQGQTEDQMYLLGLPRLPDARLAEIIGPFGTTTQIPVRSKPGKSAGWPTDSTEEKFTDVFYGNWADVVLLRGVGMNVDSDAGRGKGFASGHEYMKLYGYFDTVFRHPESLVMASDVRAFD